MNSHWIWSEDWTDAQDKEPTAVLFRKRIFLKHDGKRSVIRISADSRYKLYINGRFVEAGPSKGDSQIWFYDEIDIGERLRQGENILAVIVLRFPIKPGLGNQSLIGTHTPGLYISGSVEDKGGAVEELSADKTWKCRIDTQTSFLSEAEGFAPLHIYEKVRGGKQFRQWKQAGYDDHCWKEAIPYPKAAIREAVSPGNLNSRTIPFMKRQKRCFSRISAWRKPQAECCRLEEEQWKLMLFGEGAAVIPADSEYIVELDAGEEMTGYLHLCLEHGRGAVVELTQAEAYVQPDVPQQGNTPFKSDREDSIRGILKGYQDTYIVSGFGTSKEAEDYEPYWFRTFRFLKLRVVTGKVPLTIKNLFFEETGYPLEIKTKVETSDPSLSQIWDISARTLKRCMQETYIDCPYYEQLQYVMDSRAQILYTYAISMDDRLARKTMDDFRRSQRYDGLLSSAYPNTRPNVIPGFSIFYILMIHDHMMYFGDRELVRYHMPSIENILYFFERNLTEEGYVGKIGGEYRKEKFWSFIDWVPDWNVGVPTATRQGAITMESLLYLMGLQRAAELARYIGRISQAEEFSKKAEEVRLSIQKYCISENGWIQDGPGMEVYSQHCQVFGILTGVLDVVQGRDKLRETMEHRKSYAQCTVSMAWYLFRALELTDLYEKTNDCWEIWREMIRNNMTTVAESDVYPRSDCHAWGALALYELPAVILGVRPAKPGYEEIEIHPVPGHLTWAKGEVITPQGMVSVEWEMTQSEIEIKAYLDGVSII